MNHGSLRASLLMICIFAAQAASAQCPEGKAEVVVVTPSGVSKNICVAQAAIPGIENAANNEVIEIAPVCPCVDVWTGVYSDDVAITGTPPTLPADLTGTTCSAFMLPPYIGAGAGVRALRRTSETTETGFLTATIESQADSCTAAIFVNGQPAHQAILAVPFQTLYPQENLSTANIDDPRLEACRQYLDDRGCTF